MAFMQDKKFPVILFGC